MTKTKKEKVVKTDLKEIHVKHDPMVEVEDETRAVAPFEAPVTPANFKDKLTKGQKDLIKNTIAKGASDDELKMFLYVCQRTGLDPFTKQIHLVPRWDSKLGREVRQPIVGIDGLRAIAEKTGVYAGNDDPVFDDEAKPTKATVTVYKVIQGHRWPFTATARFDQYVPKKADGTVTSPLWNKMPHLMLGKCAEALALRKAFPTVMSGLYVTEEIQQAQEATTGITDGAETDYDKATRLLGKMNNLDGLREAKDKIAGSDKYTLKDKKALERLIDKRIEELTPKEDAPRNVPPPQHDEAGRGFGTEL